MPLERFSEPELLSRKPAQEFDTEDVATTSYLLVIVMTLRPTPV